MRNIAWCFAGKFPPDSSKLSFTSRSESLWKKNFSESSGLFLSFGRCWTFLGLLSKFSGRLVKTAIYVPRGTVPGKSSIFGNIVSLGRFHTWIKCFSPFWRKVFRRALKAAFSASRGFFAEN